jgi:hypothetical protein
MAADTRSRVHFFPAWQEIRDVAASSLRLVLGSMRGKKAIETRDARLARQRGNFKVAGPDSLAERL